MEQIDDLFLDTERLKDPLFWEKVWQEYMEKSLFRRERETLKETVKFWNKRADNYQKNVMGQKGSKRVNRVLDWLETQGMELAGKKVLDIGAGPGAFALAFARRCHSVVALEPAAGMVSYLQAEIARSGLENVRVIQKAWEQVDLEKEGFYGSFDLVFASMSPGINNMDTIQKALDCSKEYFYYSSFAGRRDSDLLRKLWPALYGINLPPWPDQAFFVLNLLYTLDLQLKFEVWEEGRRTKLAVAEAVDNLMEELRIYGKEPPYPREKVQDFVATHARDGIVPQENSTRLGQILSKKRSLRQE